MVMAVVVPSSASFDASETKTMVDAAVDDDEDEDGTHDTRPERPVATCDSDGGSKHDLLVVSFSKFDP